MLPDQHIAGVN